MCKIEIAEQAYIYFEHHFVSAAIKNLYEIYTVYTSKIAVPKYMLMYKIHLCIMSRHCRRIEPRASG